MYKLFLLALILAAASSAPTYELYHPPASYSYSSSYVQHPAPAPILKTYAHPVVVPVAPVVKTVVPVVKTYPHPLYHSYPLYASHYF
ncbi:hypothetical protein PGB90_006124 [Kerria lacca]